MKRYFFIIFIFLLIILSLYEFDFSKNLTDIYAINFNDLNFIGNSSFLNDSGSNNSFDVFNAENTSEEEKKVSDKSVKYKNIKMYNKTESILICSLIVCGFVSVTLGIAMIIAEFEKRWFD